MVFPGCGGGAFVRLPNGFEWRTLPAVNDHTVHRYDLYQAISESEPAIALTTQRIRQVLRAHHRVWVMTTIPFLEDTSPPLLPRTRPRLPHGMFLWKMRVSIELSRSGHRISRWAPEEAVSIYETLSLAEWRGRGQ